MQNNQVHSPQKKVANRLVYNYPACPEPPNHTPREILQYSLLAHLFVSLRNNNVVNQVKYFARPGPCDILDCFPGKLAHTFWAWCKPRLMQISDTLGPEGGQKVFQLRRGREVGTCLS